MKRIRTKWLLMSILIITLAGCSNDWNKADKMILESQSVTALKFANTQKTDEEFRKCFKNHILENYTGKEYMNGGSTIGLSAIALCNN